MHRSKNKHCFEERRVRIVEKVSGEAFGAFARRRLLLSPGMNHTLDNDDATTIKPNRVIPYNPRAKAYVEVYRKAGFDVNHAAAGYSIHVIYRHMAVAVSIPRLITSSNGKQTLSASGLAVSNLRPDASNQPLSA
ncbi:MAG: hypothetical protein M3O71_15925 [Bacteroidota bacterium]|nr:hypothetical protein [Bacteroidota bacterium]